MCDTCGCGQPGKGVTIQKPGAPAQEHQHDSHNHDHDHSHHTHEHSRTLEIQQNILTKNNLRAERNRGYFEARNILTLNLVSSPGSGKTTLLEKTIVRLKEKVSIAVIEGDLQSLNDAERIDATGVPVVQVNTGAGCHLDAEMIGNAIKQLPLEDHSLLIIENVGNLVCPALFDLGEAFKVVIISVTEGDDKPHKYPIMFDAANICLINKIDLMPYVDFDIEQCKRNALQVNHHLTFYELSAKTGEGVDPWINWLQQHI